MADQPLISAEEMASVLAGDESDPGTPPAEGPSLYSLRSPLAIAPSEEPAARERLRQVAATLQSVLLDELEAELALKVMGFQQRPAQVALDTLPSPRWILSFRRKQGDGIALVLDPICALAVVELALGGQGDHRGAAREPTPLEIRVMGSLLAALTRSLEEQTADAYEAGRFSLNALPSQLAAAGETVGCGLLKFRIGETDHSALLLVTAGLLREAEGASSPRSAVPGPLLPRAERVPVPVRPVLRGGGVALSELLQLVPGTVLRLEARTEQPLELRVVGRTQFLGHVARQDTGPTFRITWRRGRSNHG